MSAFRLTIVKPDNLVGIDGLFYKVDLSLIESLQNIRAVQWDGAEGHIEANDGSNSVLTELGLKDFQLAIDGWNEAKKSVVLDTSETNKAELKAAIEAVHQTYPAVNKDSFDIAIQKKYKNLTIAPLIRASDTATIAIEVTMAAGVDGTAGAIALLSLRTCTNDLIALGIPMVALIWPEAGTIDKDEYATFLLSISKYNSIITNPVANYVYQKWNVDFAKSRKNEIINSERMAKINNGITWNGNVWDTDSESRTNLTNAQTAINAGATLPSDFSWRTADNKNITVNAANVTSLNLAVNTHITTCYQESWARKGLLNALASTATYAEIEAI
jgi:hypothetical protein